MPRISLQLALATLSPALACFSTGAIRPIDDDDRGSETSEDPSDDTPQDETPKNENFSRCNTQAPPPPNHEKPSSDCELEDTIWCSTWGSEFTRAQSSAIVVDCEGALWVGGNLGETPYETGHAFLRKFSASGELDWQWTYEAPPESSPGIEALRLGAEGRVWALMHGTGVRRSRLLRFNAEGDVEKTIDTDQSIRLFDLDAAGRPVLFTEGNTSDGPCSNELDCMELLGLDDDGEVRWHRELAGKPDTAMGFGGMAIGPDGQLVVSGSLAGEYWLARIDAEGKTLWEIRGLDDDGSDDLAEVLHVDSSGSILLNVYGDVESDDGDDRTTSQTLARANRRNPQRGTLMVYESNVDTPKRVYRDDVYFAAPLDSGGVLAVENSTYLCSAITIDAQGEQTWSHQLPDRPTCHAYAVSPDRSVIYGVGNLDDTDGRMRAHIVAMAVGRAK